MAEREARVSARELARLYADVDYRTIQNWVAAGCPHRKKDNRLEFLLSEVIPWRREKDKQEMRGPGTADEDAERVRKLSAEADLAELKRDEMRGALVPASDVERHWERVLGVLRSRITASRGKWAPKMLGLATMPEASARMDELVADLLAALQSGADEIEDLEPETEEEAA